jgi:hypothetical protein
MTKFITVDCTIGRNGRVWIHRVKFDEEWVVVEQGRQWQGEDGRHVLVMPPVGQVEELLLSGETLRWELVQRRGMQII